MGPFPTAGRELRVVAGSLDDLDQSVGATLSSGLRVCGVGGHEEGLEGCGEESCGLGVEESGERGHPIHQRGQRQMTPVELTLCVVPMTRRDQGRTAGAWPPFERHPLARSRHVGEHVDPSELLVSR